MHGYMYTCKNNSSSPIQIAVELSEYETSSKISRVNFK